MTELDTKSRKSLTMYKMHHPNSDGVRLYLPEPKEVEGLYNSTFATTTIGLDKYLKRRRKSS